MAIRQLSEMLMQGIRPRDLPENLTTQVLDGDAPIKLVSSAFVYNYYRELDRGKPSEAIACLDRLAVQIRQGRAARPVDFAAETAFYLAHYLQAGQRAAAILAKLDSSHMKRPMVLRAQAAVALEASDWDKAIHFASEARRRLTFRYDYGLTEAEDDWLHDIILRAELGRATEISMVLGAPLAPTKGPSRATQQNYSPTQATNSPSLSRVTTKRFDKFTLRARDMLTFAQEEAIRFNHNYVGTEHLLMGLIRLDTGMGCRALVSMGVQLAQVKHAVESIVERDDSPIAEFTGLTPRAKNAIELSVHEARLLGHNYVGTEHLLLGLASTDDSIAFAVLVSLGVRLDRLREATRLILEEAQPVADGPSAKASS
jgi:hypothetical protein